MKDLDTELAQLDGLGLAELRGRWTRLTATPVPEISARLLHLALAWELQARALGGHSRSTTRTLDQLERGESRTQAAAPGTRLVREWQGRVHVVTVGDDGAVTWEERRYRCLSEVARAITGTRWSGPAFFGLKRKASAA